MSKRKSKPQGHPARINRDPLQIEIEKLANRLVQLVPSVIKDSRFDPEDVIVAKAGSIAALHLLAVLDGKPTPAEVYGYGKHGYHLAKIAAGHADATDAQLSKAVAKAATQLAETE